MNEPNPLEKQLASWTPRRPSARLRRQLFETAPAPQRQSAPLTPAWVTLTAATCVILLASVFLLPRPDKTFSQNDSSGSNLLASLALSGQSCQQWNLWSAVTFEWTKVTPSLSITDSFGLGRTNL